MKYWFVETLITLPLNDKYVSRSLAYNRLNNKFGYVYIHVYVYIYTKLVINRVCVCVHVKQYTKQVSAGNEECNATFRNMKVEFILAISPFA